MGPGRPSPSMSSPRTLSRTSRPRSRTRRAFPPISSASFLRASSSRTGARFLTTTSRRRAPCISYYASVAERANLGRKKKKGMPQSRRGKSPRRKLTVTKGGHESHLRRKLRELQQKPPQEKLYIICSRSIFKFTLLGSVLPCTPRLILVAHY